MFSKLKFILLLVIIFCVSCQFNMKVTEDESNKISFRKIGPSNFYMKNDTGLKSNEVDIFIDNNKFNLDELDMSGIRLDPGKHNIKILNKLSRDPADFFEFDVNDRESKRIYLCKDPNDPLHFQFGVNKDCKK